VLKRAGELGRGITSQILTQAADALAGKQSPPRCDNNSAAGNDRILPTKQPVHLGTGMPRAICRIALAYHRQSRGF